MSVSAGSWVLIRAMLLLASVLQNPEIITTPSQAVGDPGSNNHALGPMQVQPATAADLVNNYRPELKMATAKLIGDLTLSAKERANLIAFQDILDKPVVAAADMRGMLRDKNIGVMIGMKYMGHIGVASAPMTKERVEIKHGQKTVVPAHLDLTRVAYNRMRYVDPSFRGDVASVRHASVEANPDIFGPGGAHKVMATIEAGIKHYDNAATIIQAASNAPKPASMWDLQGR